MTDKKLLVMALLELAKDNLEQLHKIEVMIADVLGVDCEEGSYFGHVSDAVFCAYTVDELFDKLEIKE